MLTVGRLTRSLYYLSRHVKIPKLCFGAKKDKKVETPPDIDDQEDEMFQQQVDSRLKRFMPSQKVFVEEGDQLEIEEDEDAVEDSEIGSTLEADKFMQDFEFQDVTFVEMLRDLQYNKELEDMDLSHRLMEALDTFDFLSSNPEEMLKEYREKQKSGQPKKPKFKVELDVDQDGKKIVRPMYLDVKLGKLMPVEEPLSKTEWKEKYGREYTLEDIEKLKIIQEFVFSTLEYDEAQRVKTYLSKRQAQMRKQRERQKKIRSKKAAQAKVEENTENQKPKIQRQKEKEQKPENQINIKAGSKLYEKFIKTQERPMLTKDNYQLNLGLILHRLPIFLPYDPEAFKAYMKRYELVRRAGHSNPGIPELAAQLSNPQLEIEVPNPDNFITHLTEGKARQMYAQNSKYWKLVDPNVNDPSSIQYKSSQMVFLIVKNQRGEWTLPDWPVKEKETIESMKKGIAEDITGNMNPHIHWISNLPCFIHKRLVDGLERGIGIKTLYFEAAHINGVFEKNPSKRKSWKEFRWAPKGELAKYFSEDYFKTIIRSVQSVL